MRYAIVGAGAIGGYYGGLLAQAADVTFLARGETLATLRTRGLEHRSADGVQRLPVHATDNVADIGEVDVVIVTTKARGLRDALQTVQPLLDAGAMVMTVQNGVEAPHIAAEYTPAENVIPCVVRGFLELQAPATIAYHGGPRSFTFGHWFGAPSPVIDGIVDDITAAGFDAIALNDIWVDVWHKAMFVVPFGALGALTGEPLGTLRTALRTHFARTIAEVRAVGEAMEAPVNDASLDIVMAFADAMPDDVTTSMQRDILAGLPSELDSQVGGLVRMAARHGVDVPLLSLCFDVLSRRPGQP